MKQPSLTDCFQETKLFFNFHQHNSQPLLLIAWQPLNISQRWTGSYLKWGIYHAAVTVKRMTIRYSGGSRAAGVRENAELENTQGEGPRTPWTWKLARPLNWKDGEQLHSEFRTAKASTDHPRSLARRLHNETAPLQYALDLWKYALIIRYLQPWNN